jgi:phosphatidylserine/phosphatidylglycerophosphate/cardiolipin synthase-like enzyme
MTNRFQDWLLPERSKGTPDAWRTAQSDEATALAYTDYKSYFERLATLFEQTKDGDQIFLVGWEFRLDEELRAGTSARTLLYKAIQSKKVRVRLLATAGASTEGENRAEVAKAIQGGIDAEMDEQYIDDTSHHQKAVYVTTQGTPHLLLGGMDIALGFAPERRVGKWFDVQAEVIGRAADLGLLTLEERWASVKNAKAGATPTVFTPVFSPLRGNNHTSVQFCRTYGKADKHATTNGRTYAPAGDFTYSELLAHAITKAENFIYLEDQFFWQMGTDAGSLDALLKAAAARGVTIVVVGARPNEIGNPAWRQDLITDLLSSAGDRGRFHLLQFKLGKPPPEPYFVHTKTWIFDDKLAVIGSANYWLPSMTGSSEFGVAIASTWAPPEFPGVPFARALRARMWDRLLQAVPGSASLNKRPYVKFHDDLAVLTGVRSPLQTMVT